MDRQAVWDRFQRVIGNLAGLIDGQSAYEPLWNWHGLEMMEPRLLLSIGTPEGLEATPGYEESHEVELEWQDVEGAESYNVYRQVGTSAFDLLTYGLESCSCTDKGLEANTPYGYRVTAVGSDDAEANVDLESYHAEVSVTTLPTAPSDVEARWTSANEIELTWTGSPGASGYYVYRKVDEGEDQEIGEASECFYTDTDSSLDRDKEYIYTIKAFKTIHIEGEDTDVESEPSLEAPTLVAEVSLNKVALSWGTVTWAEQYHVYRGTTAEPALFERYVAVPEEPGYLNTWEDYWIDPSGEVTYKYIYRVVAVSKKGKSTAEVEAEKTYPPAPTDLTAEHGEGPSVVLEWTSVEGCEYNIYRRPADGSWAKIVGLHDASSYTDTDSENLSPGTKYCYYVTAVEDVQGTDPDKEGPPSRAAAATIPAEYNPPEAPANVYHSDEDGQTADERTLYWDRVAGAEGYEIRRYTGTVWVKVADVEDTGDLRYQSCEFDHDSGSTRIAAYTTVDEQTCYSCWVGSTSVVTCAPPAPDHDISAIILTDDEYVIVNDNDDDGDMIPDFADGYDLDPDVDFDDSGITGEGNFVRFKVRLGGLDTCVEHPDKVRFQYSSSDPDKVELPTCSCQVHEPASGTMRIWKKDGAVTRTTGTGGDFVPDADGGCGEFELSELGFACSYEASFDKVGTFYLEGIDAFSCAEIDFEVGRWNGSSYTWTEVASTSVAVFDVSLSGDEYVRINHDDDDNDGIRDDRDGFNADGILASDGVHELDNDTYIDTDAAEDDLEAFTLGLSSWDGRDNSRFRIYYELESGDESDPIEVDPEMPAMAGGEYTYPDTEGILRLWSGSDASSRTIDPADTRPQKTGYLRGYSDTCEGTLDAKDLGVDGSASGTIYAEGVGHGSGRIELRIDPDGDGPGRWVTAEYLDLSVIANDEVVAVNDDDDDNDGVVDLADGYDLDEDSGPVPALDNENSCGDDFVEVKVAFPGDVAERLDKLHITYASDCNSDPADDVSRSGAGTREDPYYWSVSDGSVRLWTSTSSESTARDKNPFLDEGNPGDYVGPGEYSYSDLTVMGFSEDTPCLSFYLEGVADTGSSGVQIDFRVDLDVNWDDGSCDPSFSVKVSAVETDLDVDSSNGASMDDEQEDQIENNDSCTCIDTYTEVTRPGMIVPVNDGDLDEDGIPDFADGFNRDEVVDSEYHESTDDDHVFLEVDGVATSDVDKLLTPVEITLPASLDLDKARVKIEYEASDPAAIEVTGLGTRWDPYVYRLPGQKADGSFDADAGYLRLWTRADGASNDNKRSARPVYDPGTVTERGFYVPPTFPETCACDITEDDPVHLKDYYELEDLEALGFSPTNRTVTLYLEAVRDDYDGSCSYYASKPDHRITVKVDPDGRGPMDFQSVDTVLVKTGAGDVDIDSENTCGTCSTLRTEDQDRIEDTATRPGKIILVNNGDKDGDGLPDFADGFDWDSSCTDDDGNLEEAMVPIDFEIPSWVDKDEVKFSFSYKGSDPCDLSRVSGTENVGYELPSDGVLRLWTCWSGSSRDPDSADNGGNYVTPDTYYTLEELGATDSGQTKITLYLEAVQPSEKLGDGKIEAYLSYKESGSYGAHPILLDAVRVTALGDTNANGYSGAVRYSDGKVTLSWSDLISGGYSGPWGQTRTFTDQLAFDFNGVNGNGFTANLPQLVPAGGGIVVVRGGQSLYFDRRTNGSYVARFDTKTVLNQSGSYCLTEAGGSKWEFHNFSSSLPVLQRGSFKSFTDPANNPTSVTVRDDDGRIKCVSRAAGDEIFVYEYDTEEGSCTKGLLKSVALKRKVAPNWLIVGVASYDYYGKDTSGENDTNGNHGDLRAATVFYGPREGDDGNAVDTTYYRYKEKHNPRYPSRMALVIEPDSYQRACEGVGDPRTTSSSLDSYAAFRFDYHQDDGRVEKQWIQGAGASEGVNDDTAGRFEYTYDSCNTPAVGFNIWRHETVETQPLGTENTVYTNFAGQVMLTATDPDPTNPSSGVWHVFNQYDESGRVVLTANPSAVEAFCATNPDLLCLSGGNYDGLYDFSGLIRHYDYYTCGTEDGYLKKVWVSQGDGETSEKATELELSYGYDHGLVLVDTETVYRNPNETGPIVTDYDYVEWENKLPTRITVKLPMVGEETSAPTVIRDYDKYGRLESLRDANEETHSWDYDDPTGALTEEIIDNEGMYLTTTVVPDKFGRPEKITYPTGFVAEYAYSDTAACSEVTVSFAKTLNIYPMEFYKYDRGKGVVYSGTMDQGTQEVRSLTREHLDRGGRVMKVHDFYTLSLTYDDLWPDCGSPCDYLKTCYKYDERGRLQQVMDPNGIYTRFEFDGLDRPIKTSMGDSEVSLDLLSENQYDGGGVGDGNVTRYKEYTTATTCYVTKMKYDWRNRLEQTLAPDKVGTILTPNNLGWVEEVKTYQDDNGDLPVATTTLLAKNTTCYDDRARVTNTTEYGVKAGEGSGEERVTTYDYDTIGQVTGVLGPDDIYHETCYNGAGMVVGEYDREESKSGTCFYAKEYEYKENGDGRLASISEGSGPGNTIMTYKVYYDTTFDGCGVDHFRVTGTESLKATSEEDDFALTRYEYNDEGLQHRTIAPDGTRTETTFDALGRATKADTCSSGDTLLARNMTCYDGARLKETYVYHVEGGSCGAGQMTAYGYDQLGRLDKVTSPAGSYRETTYNLAGEVTEERLVASSTDIEKTVYTRDTAGRLYLTTMGQYDGSSTRTTYVATWYDALGRIVKTVDYGTNDDGTPIESIESDFDPEMVGVQDYSCGGPDPNGDPGSQVGHKYIVSETGYDALGRVSTTTDNKNVVTKTVYEGETDRVAYVIENYKPGSCYWNGGEEDYSSPKQRKPDECRITRYTYTGAGLLHEQIAVDPDAGGDTDDNQTTTYTYSDGASGPKRKDLLVDVLYPGDGDPADRRVSYSYHNDSSRKTFTDQRGTVHEYVYDDMSRLQADKITSCGSGTDVSVRSITRAYDDLGRLVKITSHGNETDNPDNTDCVKDQITFDYDGWGHVEVENQSHLDVVDGSTANVEYEYGETGPTAEMLQEVTYPDGRTVQYGYAGGIDSQLSRVSSITSGTTTHATYSYIGAGWIVEVGHGNGVTLTYDTGDSGGHDGLDYFGRIQTQIWENSSSTAIDKVEHTYDRNSNRLTRATLAAEQDPERDYDEDYAYDELNRLVHFEREGDDSGESFFQLPEIETSPPEFSGHRTAASGNTVVIGVPMATIDEQERAGAVYVFQNHGSGWEQIVKLTADIPTAEDRFGMSVDISGNAIIVGTPRDDDNSFSDSGSAYVFRYNGSTWGQEDKLTAGDTAAGDWFGCSVAIHGDTAIVSAVGVGTWNGSAYIFEHDELDEEWDEKTELTPNPSHQNQCFGESVAIMDGWAIVGARRDESEAADAGAAYVFEGSGLSWSQEARLVASDAFQSDYLGVSVAIVPKGDDGYTALVGARGSDASGTDSGSAYIFESKEEEPGWEQIAQLKGSDTAAGDYFGQSVSLDGNTAIVGAYLHDHDSVTDSGAAYIFRPDKTDGWSDWTEAKELTGDDPAESERFGIAVAVNGDYAFMGNCGDGGTNAGSISICVSILGGRLEQEWEYDALGNWTETTTNGVRQDREHDAANQITHLDGEEYDIDHDKAGNMILVPKIPLPGFAPGRFVCKYDAWNRLTAVYEDDGTTPGHWDETDTKVAEYRYDGLNRRITKLVPNAQSPDNWDRTDYYYNEGWQVLEERTVSNLTDPETVAEDPHVQYVWDVRYIDAPICRFRDADGSSGNGLEETLYYTTDANFNVTALIDPADGGVVERYLYDGYGRVTVLNGAEDGDETGMDEWTIDADNVSDWDNEILYAGYRLDGETNLYHVRNRYHHPTLGRFISRDPEGYADGMSMYQYASSAPTNLTDPSGLDPYLDLWMMQRDLSSMMYGPDRTDWGRLGPRAGEMRERAKTVLSAIPGAMRGLQSPIDQLERMRSNAPSAGVPNPQYLSAGDRSWILSNYADARGWLVHKHAFFADRFPGDPIFAREARRYRSAIRYLDAAHALLAALQEASTRSSRRRMGLWDVVARPYRFLYRETSLKGSVSVAAGLAMAPRPDPRHDLHWRTGLTLSAILTMGATVKHFAASGPKSAITSGGKYDVGEYGALQGSAPRLDAHHLGQRAVMKKTIPGYDPKTAPSILVPRIGHTIRGPRGIVSRSTKGITSGRQALARDVRELRRVYPDIPNSQLKNLIELNKQKYPILRTRP